MEWWKESVFYQIYPLGFCGAERQNDFGQTRSRLKAIQDEIPRLKELGVGAVLFNPLFSSSTHGYDTADFFTVDCRLGTNSEFAALVQKLHEAGIKVVLDGVFNHVGRAFDKFTDVKINRENSPYRDWFHINFGGDSFYGDGFYYEGWEGHYDLVKLNLNNEQVRQFLFSAVRKWIAEFGIDGLRLDVGYMLPENFIRDVSGVARAEKAGFFIVAEAIHGDYNRLLNCGADSVTNYECYKGLHSAVNSKNLFEIEHSLSRQFADTAWSLYKGRHLFNFLDNHDVPRAYTVIKDKRNVACAYSILFAMPGLPCVYYGSEYGTEGDKGDCDVHLRAPMSEIDRTVHPELYQTIKSLCNLRKSRKSFAMGNYYKIALQNEYFCIARSYDGETTALAVNISDWPVTVALPFNGRDLFSGEETGSSVSVEPHSFRFISAE